MRIDELKALLLSGRTIDVGSNTADAGTPCSFSDGGVYCNTSYQICFDKNDKLFHIYSFLHSDDGDSIDGNDFTIDSFPALLQWLDDSNLLNNECLIV